MRTWAVTTSGRPLTSAGRDGITGRAAEAAFFAALALLPTVLTVVAVLRFERPAFGGDAAAKVSAGLAWLLRVVAVGGNGGINTAILDRKTDASHVKPM